MNTITIRVPRARWLLSLLGAALAAVMVTACHNGGSVTNGQARENTASNDSLTIAEQVLPAPVFKYSVYRWAFIEDQAIQALGEQTTSFAFQQGDANPIFSCPSEGMPVPNTAQLTNPAKPEWNYAGDAGVGGVTVGNIDPNQVYSPSNSQGTNILCINRQGQPYTVYAEPNVVTVAGAAHWVPGQGIVVTGAPNMPSCKVALAGTKKASTTCTK